MAAKRADWSDADAALAEVAAETDSRRPGGLAALEPEAEKVAGLLAAMANSKRLLILCALMDGERQAGELAALAGLNFSAASQHLARMRLQGLVGTRREGQANVYRLESDEVRAVLQTLYDVFCAPGR